MPDRLSDDAVVVRGGQARDPVDLVQKLTDNLEDHGIAALSVYCVEPGEDGHDAAVCKASRDGDIPHGQIQVGRLGDLRAVGFEPVLDTSDGQPDCHYNVVFGNDLETGDAERFIGCFHEPIRNPTGGKRRSK